MQQKVATNGIFGEQAAADKVFSKRAAGGGMFGKKAVDDEIFCKQQQQTRYSARKWQKMKDFEGDDKK